MKFDKVVPVIQLIARKKCIWCEGRMDIYYKPTIPLCRKCRESYLEEEIKMSMGKKKPTKERKR